LLQGVRGEKKTPRKYRRSQNWIGGKSLADAVFIPPHQEHLSELMGDLENFIQNENIEIPLLINMFVEKQMLQEYTGQSRNRIFAYEPYLALFND